jgi:hypothetical protein
VQAPGVLRIQWSDNAFSTLRLTDDGLRLTGIQRRTQAPVGNTPGEELQTAVAYDLARTASPSAPTVAGVAPPASAPAMAGPALRYLGALLVFERALKALGTVTDDGASTLLQAPALALWSPDRTRQIVSPPATLDPLEALAALTVQQKLTTQLAPHLRTAAAGFKADPGRFADVYLDLSDLQMRLSAANLRIWQRVEASSKPGNDASGTRAAAMLLIQVRLQAMAGLLEAQLPEFPASQRAQAAARLQQFRDEYADTLRPAGDPPAPTR